MIVNVQGIITQLGPTVELGIAVVILVPKDDPWKGMLDSLDLFTDDFLADGIDDLPLQERGSL